MELLKEYFCLLKFLQVFNEYLEIYLKFVVGFECDMCCGYFSDSLLLHNSQSNIFSFPGLFSLSLKNLLCWKSLVGKSTKANTKSRQLAHMIAKMVKMVGQDPLLWSFDLSRWFTRLRWKSLKISS